MLSFLEEFEQLKEDFIELEKGNKEIIEQIKFKDLQIKDLTGKINLKKGKKSELKEKIINNERYIKKSSQFVIDQFSHIEKTYNL